MARASPARSQHCTHLAGSGCADWRRQPGAERGDRGDGVTPGNCRRQSQSGQEAQPGTDWRGTAWHGPTLLPAMLMALLLVMFSFPPTFKAFPASKCQAHKERHCERKMERECLPASLRKCRLTLHQGGLCKRGTRLTTSSLCSPVTAAARCSILFSFPLVLFPWVGLQHAAHCAAAR